MQGGTNFVTALDSGQATQVEVVEEILHSQEYPLEQVSKAYRTVDRHVRYRLRKWLCMKHQDPGSRYARYSDSTLAEELELLTLIQIKCNLLIANIRF